MDLSFLNTLGDAANNIGHFMFETFEGVAILIGGCLLITLLIAVILEFRTKKQFKDHKLEEDQAEEANA